MPFINYFAGDRAGRRGTVPVRARAADSGAPRRTESELIRTPQAAKSAPAHVGQLLTFVIGIIPYVWEYQADPDRAGRGDVADRAHARFTSEFGARIRREFESFLGVGVTVEPVDRIPLEPREALIIKSSDPLS